MRLLVAGDTHGNPQQILYLGQIALNQYADAIMIVGDFGFWEHERGGPEFLDVCSEVAVRNDLPIYWIDGNHENHTMLRKVYGPGGERHHLTSEGFWKIRDGLFYIPRGTRWNWDGVECLGLGGAYSVDKDSRLREERNLRATLYRYTENTWHKNGRLQRAEKALADWGHISWWPEEEITDEEVAVALQSERPVDIMFTHDKPRASNPDWNRKDLPDCYPNQNKIQEVVRHLQPSVLIHGHLHHRYEDAIRYSTPDGGVGETLIVGLNCDETGEDSWTIMNITAEEKELT